MPIDLGGKVVVVTGASRGLGAALVDRALHLGACVGACSRTLPMPNGPAERTIARIVDVRAYGDLLHFGEQVWTALGGIDLWVNNAGLLGPVAPLREADPQALADTIAANTIGTLYGSKVYAQLCRRAGRRGVLLNLSSGAARRAYFGWSGYCSSKAAVDRLSEVVALEEEGVLRVHAVAPGVFESGMQEAIREVPADRFPSVERFVALHRDGGLSTPEAIARGLLRFAFEDDPVPRGVCVDLRDLGYR